MIRKVTVGGKFLKACGTVMEKPGKWLAANGYVDAADAGDMVDCAAEAGDELPKAEELADLLQASPAARQGSIRSRMRRRTS